MVKLSKCCVINFLTFVSFLIDCLPLSTVVESIKCFLLTTVEVLSGCLQFELHL